MMPGNGAVPEVQPAPVPFTVQTGEAVVNGNRVVVVRILTPTGTTVLFVAPDDLRKIAENLRVAATGLTIARPPSP
jgi:hypothetical protein